MVLERDSETIYIKMVVVQRDRKGSGVFRSLGQAEVNSVSAPGSPAMPSFMLGESPRGHNTTLPASLISQCLVASTLTLPGDLASRPAQAWMASSNVEYRNSHQCGEGGWTLLGGHFYQSW